LEAVIVSSAKSDGDNSPADLCGSMSVGARAFRYEINATRGRLTAREQALPSTHRGT
jgi:hypothetical protein